jgi:hypothetical protein
VGWWRECLITRYSIAQIFFSNFLKTSHFFSNVLKASQLFEGDGVLKLVMIASVITGKNSLSCLMCTIFPLTLLLIGNKQKQ